MTTIKQPTTSEIESGSLNDLIRAEIRQALLQTRCAMPGKVVSFDGTRAKVQPLLKAVLAPEEEAISLPEIVDVPVCFPVASGGASYITVPIKAGDTGTLTFFDRDMARWLYGDGKAVEPESVRIHDLTDASFTPDLTPFDKAIGASADNLVLKNSENTDSMSIIMHPNGKIEIKGTTQEMVTVLSSALGNLTTHIANLIALTTALNVKTAADNTGVAALTPAAINSTVQSEWTTAIGAATTAYGTALTNLGTDLTNITTDKTNLDTMKKV